MGVGNAAGYPASAGFIPEIWSGTANEKFYSACCAMAISNSKWEGEIKNVGDTVHVRQTPDITVRPGQSVDVPLTITNQEDAALAAGAASIEVPTGWTARRRPCPTSRPAPRRPSRSP